jgi:cation diffusion facilitator CzcD-associated flavoprotein CzcO
MRSVAIIGAGPAGLAVARWLKREGFQPVLFEKGERLGGQWSGDPACSGVWPSMHTNTCRDMTEFSDLAHPAGTPLYPSNQAMHAYLTRYAEMFDLVPRIRLRSRVVGLDQATDGAWSLRHVDAHGSVHEETYSHVVVASGRFQEPMVPAIPGLPTFGGRCGAVHAFAYKDPASYRGRRVLVVGCAVSALEIACDLVAAGAAHVVTASRRQRYIMPKIAAGVPVDHVMHTRAAVIARETRPGDTVAADLKRFIVQNFGSPDQFGALVPHADVRVAGLTQCQNYLPLVAEGRIAVKPWIESIEGPLVDFADGTTETFDGIVFGTGFKLHMPFLAEAIGRRLALDDEGADLYRFTFHPDLPQLAFAGMFQVAGPYLPPIELQARWIAYVWSGARPLPPRDEMASAIAAGAARRSEKGHMAALSVAFARVAGVEPDLARWPELANQLRDGPLLPASFRLQGRDSLLEAPRQIVAATQPPVAPPSGS